MDRVQSVRVDKDKKRKSLVSFSSVKKTWRHTLAGDVEAQKKKLIAQQLCGFNRASNELPPVVECTCSYLEQHGVWTASFPSQFDDII